jgi:hypothetical protein
MDKPNHTENIFPNLRKHSHKNSAAKLAPKEISSKLMLYQFSNNKPVPPAFPKPAIPEQPIFNSIQDSLQAVSTPNRIPPTNSFIKLSKHTKICSNSELSQFSLAKQHDSFEKPKKRYHRSTRNSNFIIKHTSPERVMQIYGSKSRNASTNDSKPKISRPKPDNLLEIKEYYKNFQEKSKELLNKLQKSVFGDNSKDL